MNQENINIGKQEADILFALYQRPFSNKRILVEVSGYSLGVISRCLKSLIAKGYLDENMRLTSLAKELFRDRAPKNAIILAAGFGMRMVPINLSSPKALLEAKGERLIERTIKQLHDAGINSITVVVGFMKEAFEYLMDEYGVNLVVNEEYASKNNISSMSLVLDELSDTYIIPSDVWCDTNPFRRNELYSWYMVSDAIDEESDVRVNRNMNLVKKPHNAGGNSMIGIAYLTKDDSEIVKENIQALANDPAFDDKTWEESLYSDGRMIVQAKVVHSEDYVEINTYEQLRDLDSCSNHLRNDALQTIAQVCNCKLEDIVDIQVLKKGMTNRSFLFTVNGSRYIMRIPGEGTDQLINRSEEALVYKTISGKAFCDDPVYINPENGYKITKYIENVRCCDSANINDLRLCIKKMKKLHRSALTVPHTFDIFERIIFYENLWGDNQSIYRDYKTTKDKVFKLKDYIEKHKCAMYLTHIDAVPDNFLFDPNTEGELSIQLTDWEYAGMQDNHVDIAMFCIYSLYSKTEVDRFIDLYFEDENGCDIETRTKIYCYISACGLLWSNWCEYKRNMGVEFGEYSLCQYRFAKEYYNYATDMMMEIGERSGS